MRREIVNPIGSKQRNYRETLIQNTCPSPALQIFRICLISIPDRGSNHPATEVTNKKTEKKTFDQKPPSR
ncbi:MAG: hypothetical protein DRP49_01670 [Spirochaetes bacterium]|nr:MAG: hypothetical protein DRP49_01670 [Spirochaetota bacterium]